MEFKHTSVLKCEVIEGLNVIKGGIYVDCTTGGAGHSIEIVKKGGKLIAIDKDIEALNFAKEKLKGYDVKFVHDDFKNLSSILINLNIEKVDGILLDLGVSSYQIDNASRGFSYMSDAPLDMRMNQEQFLTAKKIINEYGVEELKKIFYNYGQEPFSKRIAEEIVKRRKEKPIDTTFDLIDVVESVLPARVKYHAGHSCKKVFQALRIEVNGELNNLYESIMKMIDYLNPNGRICIIAFHSLEDAIVKRAFIDKIGHCTCPKILPKCVCGWEANCKLVSKKPIIPCEEEIKNNSRSKSAKLRILEKI